MDLRAPGLACSGLRPGVRWDCPYLGESSVAARPFRDPVEEPCRRLRPDPVPRVLPSVESAVPGSGLAGWSGLEGFSVAWARGWGSDDVGVSLELGAGLSSDVEELVPADTSSLPSGAM